MYIQINNRALVLPHRFCKVIGNAVKLTFDRLYFSEIKTYFKRIRIIHVYFYALFTIFAHLF